MNNWLLAIVSLIIGAVLAQLGNILFYRFRKKQDQKELMPKVSISQYTRDGSVYGQIINIGPEDIKNLEVELRWRQEGEEKRRIENRFFKPEDNSVLTSSEHIQYIKQNQDIRFASIPQLPSETITIITKGIGVKSGRELKDVSEIKIPATPKLYYI